MLTIWKFPIEILDEFELQLPKDAKILTVQTQHNRPCIWALIDPTAEVVSKKFKIYGTNHKIPTLEGITYIGTFQVDNGNYVFHLFSGD